MNAVVRIDTSLRAMGYSTQFDFLSRTGFSLLQLYERDAEPDRLKPVLLLSFAVRRPRE